MTFDRLKEPKFNTTVKVINLATFFDLNGNKQNLVQIPGPVKVLEVKEINDQVFYRIGDQKHWINKADTDWNRSQNKVPIKQAGGHFVNADLSKDIVPPKETAMKNPALDYDLSLKKGLTLEQNSAAPVGNEIRRIFKNGDKLPVATKFEWIYPPDTSQAKYTNAKVKIIFPDGTSKEHRVHYNLAQNNREKVINSAPKASLNPVKNPTPSQKVVPNNSKLILGQQHNQIQNLKFAQIKQISDLEVFHKNIDEVLRLYQQGYYKQMSNTIRQALEMMTKKLLQLNRINPGNGWENANLSNRLGYIACLKLLPKKIMDLCFSIKNYGNIGSHHTEEAIFTQTSALTDLSQFHDLLIYLVNTYYGQKLDFADVQISVDKLQHPRWYNKPEMNPRYPTFGQYLMQKNGQNINFNQQNTQDYTNPALSVNTSKTQKEKMSPAMKMIISAFALIALIVCAGIGYEVYQMYYPAPAKAFKNAKPSIKDQAARLTTKEVVSLSMVYANLKLGDTWQTAFDNVTSNGYEVDRYDQYTFGDINVSAQGNNYVYVLEKGVGFGFQSKANNQKLVTFFSAGQADVPTHIYTFQMLRDVKQSGDWSKVEMLAKKLNFTNAE